MPLREAAESDLFQRATPGPEVLDAMISDALGGPAAVERLLPSPVDRNWGAISTAGLWRVDVAARTASGGRSSYAFFVKLLRHPRHWPHVHLVPEGAPRDRFVQAVPWRLELEMRECGIADVLPPGMRLPRLHGAYDVDADHLALWSEFVESRAPRSWTDEDYARTAFLLGRLAARRRAGAEVNDRLPGYCRVPPRDGALRYYVEHRVLRGIGPVLRDGRVWRHPLLARSLTEAGDTDLPVDMLSLLDRLPALLDLLETLPQTYAHGDASPQNLLIPTHATDTRVVVDWGFATSLPVGFDLGQLLVGVANDEVCDVDRLPALFTAVLPAYLEGLSVERYDAGPADVRTGFVAGLLARTGLAAVPFELLGEPGVEQYGDLLVNQLRLTRYLLDLAATLPIA